MSDSNNEVPSVLGAQWISGGRTSNSSEVRKAADYAMEMAEQLEVFASCKGLDSVYQNAASIESELVARKRTPNCCMQTTVTIFVCGWTNCGALWSRSL